MFTRIKNKLVYLLNKAVKPEIIGGWALNTRLKNVRISNMSHLSNKKNIELHDHVFIGHFNYIDGYNKISIGEGVQVTNYVSILTHSSHNSIRFHGAHYCEDATNNMLNELVEGPVIIGAYSYIGAHAVIMPGVSMGKGCIVSAFSYVKAGNYPDYSIIRGIPAQIAGSIQEKDKEVLKNNPALATKYFDNGDK